ncbi:hypothetical protein [Sporosarcina koreensis]|uniref:hypothetical protein n=1 Tax=Sporosarcina koreensis TaxID=334735 RepID=UPI00075B518F|nr:hypothetical protein [Sporosarcina koreensis]
MAKYNYDRYSINYSWREPPIGATGTIGTRLGGLHKTAKWNSTEGKYVLSDPYDPYNYIPAGSVAYHYRPEADGYLDKYTSRTGQYGDADVTCDREIRYNKDKTQVRTRGLYKNTVQAEDGTYPINGPHIDGNWYVRTSLANTAPTTPGAFTQPTGELEIGDSKVFSVGASTDAEGNLSKYIWEASINGGAFSKVGETSTPSLTYKIPTATSLRMRVKAVDSGGLESGYRDSATFTVTKPKYYWSKYNAIREVSFKEGEWVSIGRASVHNTNFYYPAYTFDTKTGKFSPSGAHVATPALGRYYGMEGSGGKGVKRVDGPYSGIEDWYYFDASTKNAVEEIIYSRGSLVQSGLQAIEGTYPNDGRHSDGFYYVRGSRVNQSIAPPAPFTVPSSGAILEPKQALTLTFGASTASAISTYEVQSRYNGGAWQNVGTHTNALTRAFTVTDDKTLTTVEFRVRAKNTSGVYSDYVYSEAFTIQHNKIPAITLETENNKTLYEKDAFVIKGTALEPDIGDVLIVYYRINGGTARGFETKVSDGKPVPFNEQLTFKSGKLYKGETAITGALADGTPHTLEVWATDNQGGKSEIETRTFYVVPNRPPSLTIDPIDYQSGLIDADKVTVTGESFDADGNDVVVRYRINNGINVEIHNGPAGKFSFDVSVSKLKDGINDIVVEVSDTYDFKYSKTIKLNRIENLTPLLQSVQRWTINPPAGSAQGVLFWIKRDESQDVSIEISMTNGTEPENFVPMDFDSSGPDEIGTVEDFFKYRASSPAEKIAIKISWTGDKPIHQIQGALTQ